MATKSISTRISLVGEQEWRRSVDACRAALAEYKSEVALVNAQYKDSAITLEGLIQKEKSQERVVSELSNLNSLFRQRARELQTALEEQKKATQEYDEVVEYLTQGLLEEEAAHGKNTEAYKNAEVVLKQYKDSMTASSEAEKNYQKDLSQTNTQLNNNEKQLVAEDRELQKVRNTVEALQDPTKRFGLAVSEMDEAVQAATLVLQNYVNKGLQELYTALKESVQAALEFESTLVKVQKTTSMDSEEIAEFGEKLKDVSTMMPITTQELGAIAEAAGQLGIANEDLLEFTETMAMMGVSTNFSADEAATALAQIASVTGMTADEYTRLGSSIVAVGNNFATTESRVAALTQRIAGAGTNAGMTESQMVGLATAVASLGIGIDAGGTAIQTLINKMEMAVSTGDGLDAWAKAMKMSTDDLVVAWRTNATGALQQLIGSLGETDDAMIETLRSIGISEQRLTRVVTLLANAENNTGLLTRALDTANEAWATNSALQEEARKQFETAESKVTMFNNSLNNLKIAIGDDLLPIVGEAASMGNDIVKVLTEFVEQNPAVVSAISGLVAGLGAMAAIIGTKTVLGLPAVAEALDAIALASKALLSPWGMLLVAVSALGTAALVASANMDSYLKSTKEWTKQTKETIKTAEDNIKTIGETNKALLEQVDVVNELIEKDNKTVDEKRVLTSLIDDLNRSIPELNAKLNDEGNALVDINTNAEISAKQLHAMAYSLAETAIQEEKLNALKQLYVDRAHYTEQLAVQQAKLKDAQKKMTEAMINGDERAAEYEATVNDLTSSCNLLTSELETVTDKINEYEVGVAGAADTSAEAVNDLDRLAASLKLQQQQFVEAKESAEENMEGIVGSFDRVSEASTMSYWTIMENLQSQIDYMNAYSDNMDSLTSRNIKDIDLFAQRFADGTQESANMLASFRSMSDDQIKAIIERYNSVPPVMDKWSTTLAQVSTGVKKSSDQMIADINRIYRAAQDARSMIAYFGGSDAVDRILKGGHAQGLEYVPYDDYATMLHEGEMVLTKAEARAYRQDHTTGQSITNNTRNFGGVTLNVYSRQGQNIDELADEIMYRIEDATKRKEAVWA